MKTVLIAAPVHHVLSEGLQAAGYDLIAGEKFSRAEILQVLPEVTGIITSTRLTLDRETLAMARALRWMGRMGSGMEIIDLKAAAEMGIFVCSSPEGNCNAVAEHALGMLLSVMRHIPRSFEEIKNGKWLREENRGHELEGKTIGIIGYGHTGAAFAKKLAGFEVQVLAYDILPNPNHPLYPYVIWSSLERVLEEAEVISFHVTLNDVTTHYFNDPFLEKLQRRVILINTSRGRVVDSGTLVKGLTNGQIKGACLDVWEEEPLDRMGPKELDNLKQTIAFPNVIVTPHIAGYSVEALYKMSRILLEKLKQTL